MRIWLYLFCFSLNLISISAWASVKAYFNHNPKNSYSDPYRHIYRAGDNLEQIIIDEISNAKESVYVAIQELRLPLIAQALIEKKQAGVDVRVVLEHDYNFNVLYQRDASSETEHEATRLNDLRAFVDEDKDGRISKDELESRDAIYMLQRAGVPIMDDTFDGSNGSGLMHHKFVIVDGKNTIVSTANFTMSCIHGDILTPSTRGNANSLVVVQSSSFARFFTEEFRQLWGNGRRGSFGQNKTYRGPQTTSVRGIKLTVQFSPTSARYHWARSVNGLIATHLAQARRSVQGALFVFSDQKIADVLKKRAEVGVEMGFLVEPKFASRYYSELLDMMGLQMRGPNCRFEEDNNVWERPAKIAGVPFLERGDVLHHKYAVVDGQTVIMGSQNWSDSANYINDETLIVIEGLGVARQYSDEFDRLRKNSFLGPSNKLLADILRLEEACKGRVYSF
jgi:phosphatidylserine/phosphatidylglycerophosphate/cardiolipin synthase-like enzyme